MTSEVTTFGHVAKLYFVSEFQYKGNKQTKKNANFQQNFAVFSAATDSENIIIQILHGEGLVKSKRQKALK